MDLNRKSVLASASITSISRHDDETQENVFAMLDALTALIVHEKAAFTARKAQREAIFEKTQRDAIVLPRDVSKMKQIV